MVKYMGEDELDRQCVVRVWRMKVPNEKHQANTPEQQPAFFGESMQILAAVKGCSIVPLLCLWCQLPRDFCLHPRCLLEPWSIRDAFLYTMRQPDHPLTPNSCVCEPHDVFPCDSYPRPKKVPALSITSASNACNFGSTKEQPGWTTKGNFHPAGGQVAQISDFWEPLLMTTSPAGHPLLRSLHAASPFCQKPNATAHPLHISLPKDTSCQPLLSPQ